MRGQEGQDQLPRLLDELCALVFGVLRRPLLPGHPEAAVLAQAELSRAPVSLAGQAVGRRRQVSPAGLAAMLLGASMALMLCGSVTFMIGFLLMPWVMGLLVVLHFLGMLSNLSALGRAILCPAPASPRSLRKASGQLFSKLPIT